MQDVIDEEVWESYKRAWKLAEGMCTVFYTDKLPSNTFAAFAPSLNMIMLNRPDLSGRFAPVADSDTWRMANEASALLHEFSHAESNRAGGQKYDEYIKALLFWNFVNMDGTMLDEKERLAIFTEEMKVDTRGMTLANDHFPALKQYYSEAMVLNLGNYSSILWTGKWPDGTPQRWQDSQSLSQAMNSLKGRARERAEGFFSKGIPYGDF